MVNDSVLLSPPPDARGPREVAADLARHRRVVLLLAGVVLLSAADLIITVTHLRSVGMIEANPIAAYLIRTTGSPIVLGVYKFLTVAVCVAVLYRIRRYFLGELGAWLSVLILAGMSVIWHQYSERLGDLDDIVLAQAGSSENWLFLD
ncbi:MAG: hypothetical protein EA377_08135 [Phycisphaerales bacterium]|nr:MAG: hypothetical protein EA377_08135 [Phycisphaerales bacterium]